MASCLIVAGVAFPSAPTTRHTFVLHADLNGLVGSIKTKFKPQRILKRLQKDPNEDSISIISPEAALSASLYMTPETIHLAPSVKVTWEPAVAKHLSALRAVSNPHRPLMVGIVGIPGSGKTTSCDILAQMLGTERCLVMPMDGYHYTIAQLMEFPNADDVIYRRGACDTFDAVTLAKDLERIAHGREPMVAIPGFDHAKGDPTPNQHRFERTAHDIVLCEGLYLLHDQQGWEHIQKFLDWTIYIQADIDVCMERLKERNKCIPGYTAEEIAIRCDAVDRVNAILAEETASKYAAQIVQSGAVY
ncbi:hypothetical protein FisN_37Lh031 [Fistulifera solaris]|uniref:Phosphoribulokinase/uridine kinase domain-containing protein n=1 Tax=Fistulifera solaris TaxID=1519565 RepID=A0A1Z5K186_FISSO|nr:hypothetical protein FisN_37Lh031 [Fistulifera solaris]|eukprot:GAX19761.1 hypothetical protein FisN_37Lh031 [Fistulifera solaris]